MTVVKNEIIVEVPAEKVWSVLLNLEEVSCYNPMVKEVQSISSIKYGIGAERKCTLSNGYVKERITAIKKDHYLAMEMTESSWPLKYMRWTTEIKAIRSGKTLIRQTSIYEPGMGIMGRIMDKLILHRKMTNTLNLVFKGLKEYLESPMVINSSLKVDSE